MGQLRIHSSRTCGEKSLDYIRSDNKSVNFKLNDLPKFSEKTIEIIRSILNNQQHIQANTLAPASKAISNQSIFQIIPSSIKAVGQLTLGAAGYLGLEVAAPIAKNALKQAAQTAVDYLPTDTLLHYLGTDKDETPNEFKTPREFDFFTDGFRKGLVAALVTLTTVNLFSKRRETGKELNNLKEALKKQTQFLRENSKNLLNGILSKKENTRDSKEFEHLVAAEYELTEAIDFHNALRKKTVFNLSKFTQHRNADVIKEPFQKDSSSSNDVPEGSGEAEGSKSAEGSEAEGSGEAEGSVEAEGSGEAEGSVEAEGSGEAEGSKSAESSKSAEGSEAEGSEAEGSGKAVDSDAIEYYVEAEGSESAEGSKSAEGSGKAVDSDAKEYYVEAEGSESAEDSYNPFGVNTYTASGLGTNDNKVSASDNPAGSAFNTDDSSQSDDTFSGSAGSYVASSGSDQSRLAFATTSQDGQANPEEMTDSKTLPEKKERPQLPPRDPMKKPKTHEAKITRGSSVNSQIPATQPDADNDTPSPTNKSPAPPAEAAPTDPASRPASSEAEALAVVKVNTDSHDEDAALLESLGFPL